MRHIVVGVDGSTHAERALRWAVKEAALLEASIDLVHGYVVHPRAGMVIHDQREPASATLDAIVERNRALLEGIEWTATLVPLLWSPADALVDPAGHADLVVVGSRGLGGFKELRLGSTSYRTAAHATAPVAVIRSDGEDLDGYRRVVVGIDDSRAARRALRWRGSRNCASNRAHNGLRRGLGSALGPVSSRRRAASAAVRPIAGSTWACAATSPAAGYARGRRPSSSPVDAPLWRTCRGLLTSRRWSGGQTTATRARCAAWQCSARTGARWRAMCPVRAGPSACGAVEGHRT